MLRRVTHSFSAYYIKVMLELEPDGRDDVFSSSERELSVRICSEKTMVQVLEEFEQYFTSSQMKEDYGGEDTITDRIKGYTLISIKRSSWGMGVLMDENSFDRFTAIDDVCA